MRPSTTPLELRRQAWFMEGWKDAFYFAVNSEGDVSTIKEELELQEALIASRLTHDPAGLNSSPTIYKDGYAKGLARAVYIMESNGI
jgi:hypothetical protein